MGKGARVIRKFLVVMVAFTPLILANAVSAISSEEVFTKVLVNRAADYCYKNALVSNIDLSSYSGFNSLMNDGYKKSNSVGQGGLYIPAITDSYNSITETYSENGGRWTSCYAVFMGDATGVGTLDGNMKGLFEIYGKTAPSGHGDANALNNFMNGIMQYSIDTNTNAASSENYCYSVYVKESTTAAQPVNLGTACVNKDNYPLTANSGVTFSGGKADSGYTLTGGVKVISSNRSGSVNFDVTVTKDGSSCIKNNGGKGVEKCNATIDLGLNVPEEGKRNMNTSTYWTNAPEIYVQIEKQTGNSETSQKVSYDKDNSKAAAFVKALTGKDYNEFKFSDAEKYDFYLQYLKSNYGRSGAEIGSTTCQASKPASLVDAAASKYYIYIKGSGWCLANLDSNKINTEHAMTVFANGNDRVLTEVISTLPELINKMGALDYSNESEFIDVEQSGEGGGTVTPEPDNKDGDATCGNSGGAASLGWIVCPILDWLGNASEKIYTDYVEPSLKIEPKLFSTNQDEGTRKAWGIFQNIANGVFVVLLLLVIVSQLTGVGIDNYGIKKTLPKIIIAAILVNLSYYICLILVDLSNIVGNSVQSLLSSLSTGTPTLNIPDSNLLSSQVGSTALTGVAVLAALVGMVGAVWTNPAILLSLLVSALGIVIAIFFLFLLLSVREAAIVVLIVISPLAFVCYMLPNTKKFFDRWLKIGQGLLLVYPIAGLLVGGGDFVSRLLLSSGFASNGVFAAFSAMVIGVAPVFFIPTVLKGSFSAVGNLGTKISGFGNKLRGGVDKRIRNADSYKNAQERSLERRTRIRAGLNKDGDPTAVGGFGRFMRGGKRNMARARAQYLKNQDTRKREDSLNGVGFQAAVIGQQKRAEKDELTDYMTLINNETRNGEDEDKLYEMFDTYMAEGNKSGAVAVARIAGRRKDTASGFLNKKITGYDNKTGAISDVAKGYNSKVLSSVMKEIATGENSGTYRSSTPIGFEFAAQYNRAYKENYNEGDARPESAYSAWRTTANVDRSMGNYITNSQELVGAKGASLTEIADLVANGGMSDFERNRLQRLASATIDNRDKTGVWDTTKEEQIYRLAGREAEYRAIVQGAAGSVRGENAVAGANSAGLDVRAAVAAQSQATVAGSQPHAVPVRQQAVGSALDLSALGDETVLDIATNPNVSNNNATRVAAEQEYLRRNPGFNSNNNRQNNPQGSNQGSSEGSSQS